MSKKVQEIAKFSQTRLKLLKIQEQALRNAVAQLQQGMGLNSLDTTEMLAECGSEFTIAKSMLGNSKDELTALCQDLDKSNVEQVWHVLQEYFACSIRIRQLGELCLSLEQQYKGTYGTFCNISLASFEQMLVKLNYHTIPVTNKLIPISRDILFAAAEVITPNLKPVTAPRAASVSRNPLYNLLAKATMVVVNTAAMSKAKLEDKLVKSLYSNLGRATLHKMPSATDPELHFVLRRSKKLSSKWLIPVTGAGDHPFNWLDTLFEIADKANANCCAVDHVFNYGLDFTEPKARLEAAVEYLTIQKNVRLEDIIFVTHSNGGALAQAVAAKYNQNRLPGEGCKVILNQAYTSLADAAAHLVGKAVSKKPSQHKREYSLAESKPLAKVKNFTRTHFNKALRQQGEQYLAEELKQKVGLSNVASVIMGTKTERDPNGKRKKQRDEMLGKALEGRAQAKRAKQANKSYHRAVTKQLTKGDYVYKDCYRSEEYDNHLVIKGYLPEGNKTIHNHLDTDLIALAIGELNELQAIYANGLTPAQHLKQWFNQFYGQVQLKAAQDCKWGLKLSEHDQIMLEKFCVHLSAEKYHDWPTQAQLMLLFQADGHVAQRLCVYPQVMSQMLLGNNSEQEIHNGLLFWEQKLSTANLSARLVYPDGMIAGYGSAINEEQLQTMQADLQEFSREFKHRGLMLSEHLFTLNGQINAAALFSSKQTQHKRQQAMSPAEDSVLGKEFRPRPKVTS